MCWLLTNQHTHTHHVIQTLSLASSPSSSELSASASARFSPITCLFTSVSFVLSFTHRRSFKVTTKTRYTSHCFQWKQVTSGTAWLLWRVAALARSIVPGRFFPAKLVMSRIFFRNSLSYAVSLLFLIVIRCSSYQTFARLYAELRTAMSRTRSRCCSTKSDND